MAFRYILPVYITVVILPLLSVSLTPSTYITQADIDRLRNLFLTPPSPLDLATAHYSLFGLKELGITPPESLVKSACDTFKTIDPSNVEHLYYASSINAMSSVCKFVLTSEQKAVLEATIGEHSKVADLYHAASAMKRLNVKVDANKLDTALTAALKLDDNVLALAYSFHLATLLPSPKQETYFKRVEDAVQQADEIDGKYLQFEGGLSVTATVLVGVYKLSEAKSKSPPQLSEESAVKFANYLLSRKQVQVIKSAAKLVGALKVYEDNKFHIPVVLQLFSPISVSAKEPVVQVKICGVTGKPLSSSLTLLVDSVTRLSDTATIVSKKEAKASTADKTLYEFNLLDSKPTAGFYKITYTINPQKKDSRLVGLSGGQVTVKVMTEIGVQNVELAVADRDQTTLTKTFKAEFRSKLAETLKGDTHQRIVIRFQLVDKSTGEGMSIHQAFVRFSHRTDDSEIIFVAEREKDGSYYKFDMDIGEHEKEFSSRTGSYQVELIVGDNIISNPFVWHVCDAELKFEGQGDAGTSKYSKLDEYKPKKEIHHIFQQPETRPPTWLSKLFTGLCLLPFLVLFIFWLKIGANVSGFQFSLSTIGFHLGIGGIFLLYYMFWLQLNMFQTLRYLVAVGIFTFVCGKNMLRGVAEKSEKRQ